MVSSFFLNNEVNDDTVIQILVLILMKILFYLYKE